MSSDPSREERALSADEMTFGPDGLIVAVVQADDTDEVLMVAYMDREALARTLAERRAWFYSRSRARHWMKGEESGNVQDVVSVRYDCDADALLLRVIQRGPAGPEGAPATGVACHTGRRSCFYRELPLG